MSFPYSQAFPGALTLGAIAPGWVNKTGSNFLVQSAGFQEASPANGDACLYTANGTLTDQEIAFTGTFSYTFSTANQSFMSGMLRTNTAVSTGILIDFQPATGTATLLDIGSAFAQIGCTLLLTAAASGSPQTIGFSVVGNRAGITFNGVLYQPQDWIVPSGYTNGYCGIRCGQQGSPAANCTITSITIDGTPVAVPVTQLTEITVKPIIATGGTYDGATSSGTVPYGWFHDSVTSQWICSNGMASGGKAYNIIHTSPDLVTFTYVTGSLMSPQGSDGVIEMCGLCRIPNTVTYGANAGLYLGTGLHYNLSAGVFVTSTWISSTLIGFQTAGPTDNILPVGIVGSGDHNGQFDQSCVINPVTGKIEIWYGGIDNSLSPIRSIMMADTPDLVTWTKRGIVLSSNLPASGSNFGAPTVCYGTGPDGSANARWMSYDDASSAGYRVNFLAWAKQTSPGVWGAFTKLGPFNYQRVATTYESITTFGANMIGAFDRGDGNGIQFYANYTGQNSQVTGLVNQAAIGLGFFPAYNPIFSKTTGVASMTGVQSIAL